MGQTFSLMYSGFDRYYHPEAIPSPDEDPTFDPLLGFENGRCERKMIATEEEMISAKIPIKERDYCAHLLLKYFACRKEHWPFVQMNCSHQKHDYLNCKYDDFVIRMKEYEREKRLRRKAGGRGDFSDEVGADKDGATDGKDGKEKGNDNKKDDNKNDDDDNKKDDETISKKQKCERKNKQ